jgi:hypothetical protein
MEREEVFSPNKPDKFVTHPDSLLVGAEGSVSGDKITRL